MSKDKKLNFEFQYLGAYFKGFNSFILTIFLFPHFTNKIIIINIIILLCFLSRRLVFLANLFIKRIFNPNFVQP